MYMNPPSRSMFRTYLCLDMMCAGIQSKKVMLQGAGSGEARCGPRGREQACRRTSQPLISKAQMNIVTEITKDHKGDRRHPSRDAFTQRVRLVNLSIFTSFYHLSTSSLFPVAHHVLCSSLCCLDARGYPRAYFRCSILIACTNSAIAYRLSLPQALAPQIWQS